MTKLTFTLKFDVQSKVKGSRKGANQTCMLLFGTGVYDTDLNLLHHWFFKKEKNIDLIVPEFSGHITISRGDRDLMPNNNFAKMKALYDGKKFNLELDYANPRNEGDYWWYNLTPESEAQLLEIRKGLGLKGHILGRKLHMTIGLVSNKPKNIVASNYFKSISQNFGW